MIRQMADGTLGDRYTWGSLWLQRFEATQYVADTVEYGIPTMRFGAQICSTVDWGPDDLDASPLLRRYV